MKFLNYIIKKRESYILLLVPIYHVLEPDDRASSFSRSDSMHVTIVSYEFYAKHGIATVLQNALSQSNHKSRTTDQSSQM